jgi:transposase
VFIFVSYVHAAEGARIKFHPEYLIVPSTRLRELCKTKTASKGKYSFYFVRRDGKVLDIREKRTQSPADFSEFDSAWNLI